MSPTILVVTLKRLNSDCKSKGKGERKRLYFTRLTSNSFFQLLLAFVFFSLPKKLASGVAFCSYWIACDIWILDYFLRFFYYYRFIISVIRKCYLTDIKICGLSWLCGWIIVIFTIQPQIQQKKKSIARLQLRSYEVELLVLEVKNCWRLQFYFNYYYPTTLNKNIKLI